MKIVASCKEIKGTVIQSMDGARRAKKYVALGAFACQPILSQSRRREVSRPTLRPGSARGSRIMNK